jgi:hypothetical protein
MVGAFNQERSEVDVSSLGDAKLRIAVPGLAASRSQAEVTAHIATSLEAFFASQSQHIGQRCELPDAVDLKQRLRLRIFRLRELLDGAIVLLIFTVIAAICSSTGPSA